MPLHNKLNDYHFVNYGIMSFLNLNKKIHFKPRTTISHNNDHYLLHAVKLFIYKGGSVAYW